MDNLQYRFFVALKDGADHTRSHQAVADFTVVAELPNDYVMIEFPRVSRERLGFGV